MINRYVIAVGSNMRAPRVGGPRAVVAAGLEALEGEGISVVAISRTIASRPVGPSRRLYANAAALIETPLSPSRLLAVLHKVEHAFGRQRRGMRWRARPLDLDIILWSGGLFRSSILTIPHPHFRERSFVVRPVAQIAPSWRDPVSGLTLRQIAARAA